jgi:hypothetical protein
MKRRVIFALFALSLLSFSFVGCKSQEICPAYGDSNVEVKEVEAEKLPNS